MDNDKNEVKEQNFRKFSIGDLAVYPAHGVGRIESIESKEINGKKHDFYIMKFFENRMLIMIPVSNVESVGLRDVISKEKIPEVYDIIKGKKNSFCDNSQTWNRRYKEYMEKIRKGSLYDVAEVFRELFLLKSSKDLSFGERKLYDTAQILLVGELSTACNTDRKTIISEIELLFNPYHG